MKQVLNTLIDVELSTLKDQIRECENDLEFDELNKNYNKVLTITTKLSDEQKLNEDEVEYIEYMFQSHVLNLIS